METALQSCLHDARLGRACSCLTVFLLRTFGDKACSIHCMDKGTRRDHLLVYRRMGDNPTCLPERALSKGKFLFMRKLTGVGTCTAHAPTPLWSVLVGLGRTEDVLAAENRLHLLVGDAQRTHDDRRGSRDHPKRSLHGDSSELSLPTWGQVRKKPIHSSVRRCTEAG